DEETPDHAPETHDNGAVQALLDSGRLSDDSLATMLLRKADWHDYDGIKLLLEHRADPNRMTRWHHTALHQAVRRDNALENIELLLDHAADTTIANRADGRSAVAIAARRGRAAVLALLDRRGVAGALAGVDRLIAACARTDTAGGRPLVRREPRRARLRGLVLDRAPLARVGRGAAGRRSDRGRLRRSVRIRRSRRRTAASPRLVRSCRARRRQRRSSTARLQESPIPAGAGLDGAA